jgi:hypothetical protein
LASSRLSRSLEPSGISGSQGRSRGANDTPLLHPDLLHTRRAASRLQDGAHWCHIMRRQRLCHAGSCVQWCQAVAEQWAKVRTSEQLTSLHHPTKPCLCAVAEYEVLPDTDIWANVYDLFWFSKRPGKCRPEVRAFAVASIVELLLMDEWAFFFPFVFCLVGVCDSWMTLDWTVRSCTLWSRMAITSSRTISQRTTSRPNNSKNHKQTHAGSSLYKKRKRFVPLLPRMCTSLILVLYSLPTRTGDRVPLCARLRSGQG